MITAVDTNILIDVCLPDPKYGLISKQLLSDAVQKGSVVICEVVYAELACVFPSIKDLNNLLRETGIMLERSSEETLWLSSEIWKQAAHRLKRTERILPDFLIGAHALNHADGLLTRDRGFYKEYFKKLKVLL